MTFRPSPFAILPPGRVDSIEARSRLRVTASTYHKSLYREWPELEREIS